MIMHLLIAQLAYKIIKTAELKIKEFYKNDSLILWKKKNPHKSSLTKLSPFSKTIHKG